MREFHTNKMQFRTKASASLASMEPVGPTGGATSSASSQRQTMSSCPILSTTWKSCRTGPRGSAARNAGESPGRMAPIRRMTALLPRKMKTRGTIMLRMLMTFRSGDYRMFCRDSYSRSRECGIDVKQMICTASNMTQLLIHKIMLVSTSSIKTTSHVDQC